MKPKPTKKINGVSYDHYAQFENRDYAIETKKRLVDQGHKARFAKDKEGHYQVYVIFNNEAASEGSSKSYSAAAVQPDLAKSPGNFPIETLCCLDKLKVSLHCNIPEEFKEPIRLKKAELNDIDEIKNPEAREASLEFIDGKSLNVHSTGAGKKYSYYLTSGDIEILMSNHKADAQCPNIRIEIGSVSCWEGWLQHFENITAWLRGHGVEIVRQIITEFHIAADLLNLDYNSTGFEFKDRWVARCNRGSQHFEHWEYNYLSLGKGDFMFRCYGKTGEMKKDSAKHDFFHHLWKQETGHDVEHVTRLEFQIRRKVIKDLKINSVSDLSQKLNAIWAYCVGDGKDNKGWCRFLDQAMTPADRRNKNQQRYDTDQLWELVRNVRFGEGRTFKLVREKTQHINIQLLSSMVAGCVSTLCGAMGLSEDDVEGHINLGRYFVEDQLKRNFHKDPKEYKRKIQVKHNIAQVTF